MLVSTNHSLNVVWVLFHKCDIFSFFVAAGVKYLEGPLPTLLIQCVLLDTFPFRICWGVNLDQSVQGSNINVNVLPMIVSLSMWYCFLFLLIETWIRVHNIRSSNVFWFVCCDRHREQIAGGSGRRRPRVLSLEWPLLCLWLSHTALLPLLCLPSSDPLPLLGLLPAGWSENLYLLLPRTDTRSGVPVILEILVSIPLPDPWPAEWSKNL